MIHRNPPAVLGRIGWLFSATLVDLVDDPEGEGEMLPKGRDPS